MRLLLCNDDGFRAPGIQVLAETLRKKGHDVTIVAPNEEQSGQSHAMSFFRPLLTRCIDSHTYSVCGTPADCTAVALHDIMRDNPPEVVISGVNNGLNVGRDVNYSGTVGAATEAALAGFKAIAVSVDRKKHGQDSEFLESLKRVSELVAGILDNFACIEWPHLEVLNINYPSGIAKGLRPAECAGTNLYEALVERMETDHQRERNMRVYMLGGDIRSTFEENSEDVFLVQSGYAVMSFLQARQSSTENTNQLSDLCKRLMNG